MGEARNQWASRLAQVEKRGKAPLVNRGGSVSCGSLSCEPLSLGSQCSSLVSSRATMVRTKADSVPGTYRKAENKYSGGNPVCVRPTPKWQKGIGEFFRLSPKDSEKENRIPEEPGSSGLGKTNRKARPLQPDHSDDEKE
ncbi:PCNA-associated factor isoform X4 [Cavia porcellus]|uniref:PCNA-associated factor isoform X4 n=1 Tax=Cavia porcellus TaxID=10141 RepID=UPI000661E342|nr:PCNA-associated factor isoform X2 [Cavia porcellus]